MPNAGSYTTVAARAIGAEPIFVDVSPDSLQMTVESLRTTISLAKSKGENPKIVVVTHLFGQLNPQISELVELSRSEGLVLIEDCAQAIGATNGSKMAGSFGDLATFSFFPTKNLGAAGDAGAITGNNMAMLQTARQLRQYGWKSKYSIELPYGRNSRLDEIQAAILRIKLPYVSSWNQSRREIYNRYQMASGSKVKFYSMPDESYVGHLCPITVKAYSQKALLDFFSSKGISASVHFPIPDHRQQIELKFRDLVTLPVSEDSCASLVTIPLFPEMTEEEIQTVCNALQELGQ
jgi:dTDP-4-amino-4,6-dideoxygalactose transaminase